MSGNRISLSDIPSSDSETFLESSFFKGHKKLPTPAEVRAQGIKHKGEDAAADAWHPPPAIFPKLGLIVKYGGSITIAEGQCLWMIRKHVGNSIPVPEVYGWCRDDDQTFIYMQLIPGVPLSQRWDSLSDFEKKSLCAQLRPMVKALRTLQRSPSETWIGSVCGGPSQDIWFEGIDNVGPFPDASVFHDFFSQLYWDMGPSREVPKIEEGSALPNDYVSFVHGDLHRSNIIVSSSEDTENGSAPRVLALIDWHQAGWMPTYWEFCKMRWTVFPDDEWRTKYIKQVIQPPSPEVLYAFDYISSCHPT